MQDTIASLQNKLAQKDREIERLKSLLFHEQTKTEPIERMMQQIAPMIAESKPDPVTRIGQITATTPNGEAHMLAEVSYAHPLDMDYQAYEQRRFFVEGVYWRYWQDIMHAAFDLFRKRDDLSEEGILSDMGSLMLSVEWNLKHTSLSPELAHDIQNGINAILDSVKKGLEHIKNEQTDTGIEG